MALLKKTPIELSVNTFPHLLLIYLIVIGFSKSFKYDKKYLVKEFNLKDDTSSVAWLRESSMSNKTKDINFIFI